MVSRRLWCRSCKHCSVKSAVWWTRRIPVWCKPGLRINCVKGKGVVGFIPVAHNLSGYITPLTLLLYIWVIIIVTDNPRIHLAWILYKNRYVLSITRVYFFSLPEIKKDHADHSLLHCYGRVHCPPSLYPVSTYYTLKSDRIPHRTVWVFIIKPVILL